MGTASGGSQAAADVLTSLATIAAAVQRSPRAGRGSAYHAAVAEATAVFDRIRAGLVDSVTIGEWRAARRVAGGLLPEPSRAEWAATEAVHMQCATSPLTPRVAAAAAVRDAVWAVARAVAVTAAEWRTRHDTLQS